MAALINQPKIVDVRLHSPSTIIIAGPTGSGKTRLLIDLISQADSICTHPPDEIVYFYGIWQKAFEEISGIQFHKGFLDFEQEFAQGNGSNRWLIIDITIV